VTKREQKGWVVTMAHVPLLEAPSGVVPRLARRYTKRRFGQMVEPTAAASHHSGVLVAMGGLETAVQFGWRKLDPTLRWLAIEATASCIGCSWCIDYGYYEGMNDGIDTAKVRAVGAWRTSDLFDERERAVLEYAETATTCPAEVSDELADRIRSHLSDAEFVELAAWVALENFRSRFNAGLGLRSQGFSDDCDIPMCDAAPAKVARADAVA
jgi:alkylhydroperoxidase family enzyme